MTHNPPTGPTDTPPQTPGTSDTALTQTNLPTDEQKPALAERLTEWIERVRDWHAERRKTRLSVLPREDSDSQSLIIVLAVMCYLASLTAATLIAIDGATDRWTLDLTSTLTLRIKPASSLSNQVAFEENLQDAITRLRDTDGVINVTLIDTDAAAKLLVPWLGAEAFTQDLPIPQLIDIHIDSHNPPNLKTLETDIQAILPSAQLEDHSKWNDRILSFAGLLQTVILLLLAIIIVTTIIIVTFATRSWLIAKHEIVEALHLIGARDIFIAEQFQKKFLLLGLKSGAWGLLAAFVTISLMAVASGRISVLSEISLLPPIDLQLLALVPLMVVPVLAAILTTITARMTVLRILEKQMY